MAVKKVAFLTAGGLAPCLSSSIGFLIDAYTKKAPDVEMIGYINGYMGLLKGESIPVTPEVRKNALLLTQHGGSPIGNSRVKLTNVRDCVKRGLVKEGEDPLKVAADQLVKDGVDVLAALFLEFDEEQDGWYLGEKTKDVELIEKVLKQAIEG